MPETGQKRGRKMSPLAYLVELNKAGKHVGIIGFMRLIPEKEMKRKRNKKKNRRSAVFCLAFASLICLLFFFNFFVLLSKFS